MNEHAMCIAGKPRVPEILKEYRQWVLWKLVFKPGQSKPTKVPYDPNTGKPASVANPATWSDFETASQQYLGGGYNGIGFVFTAEDPFVFLDLDDCFDSSSGGWMPHAQSLRILLPEASWETSQSGGGLHGIVRVNDKGGLSRKARKWRDVTGNRWECYAEVRFIAFGLCDWTRLDLPTVNIETVAAFVPDAAPNVREVIDWKDCAAPDYGGPADDDELLQRALASKGGPGTMFGTAASFTALWNGNATELGKFYPDDSGKRPFDNSAAEMALANCLAWWTGRNPARIERLMNRALLCQRDKWRDRVDYRKRTIEHALTKSENYMRADGRRQQQLERDKQIGDDLSFPIVTDVITLENALENFVLIGDGSFVVDRRTKRVRQYNDFLREHSASLHPIETEKIGKDGKPVIHYVLVSKIWLSDPRRHSVDVLTWRPGEAEFCHAPERTQAGERAYNLWAGLQCLAAPPNWQGWIKPFLDHVAYLIPIEVERQRFLQWLAHIFQRPGELPHVCYLMIATTTGIGRGTLASIITRALRGYVAANMNVDALFGGFNGRIAQKLLATVDEVREGNSVNKYEKQEAFKSKLTEETRSINRKYGAQSVEKNCCRWLLFSNHLDALPFDNGDRRVIVIENPTRCRTPQEYKYLHDIMDRQEFIASVQYYLRTLDLTGFSAHEKAPLNSIKQRVLQSLESEADKTARQFKETWPADFATVNDLRKFMAEDAPTHSRVMSHVIERAGMRTAHKQKVQESSETILIVKGNLTEHELKAAPRESIRSIIIAARMSFGSS